MKEDIEEADFERVVGRGLEFNNLMNILYIQEGIHEYSEEKTWENRS